MKNDEQPADSGAPWNSDDVLFGGISCKQLSRLCTCFVSALRMANGEGKEFGIKGQMNLVRTLIDQQLALVDSPELTPEEKKHIEDNLAIGLQAVCLAGIFTINQIDARHLINVAVSTIKIVHKLAETTGPVGSDEEIMVQIRKNGDSQDGDHIEMGVLLEQSSNMAGDNIGKKIKGIFEPNDIDPFEQGPN